MMDTFAGTPLQDPAPKTVRQDATLALEITRLSHSYGERKALDDVRRGIVSYSSV